MLGDLFERYEFLAKKADILFRSIQEKYPGAVRCRIHCCDCCYAPFGLFPIEAAYLNYHFNRLDTRTKKDIFRQVEKAEADIWRAKDRLSVFDDDPKMKAYGLGKQRVRCPFLTRSDECILYEKRPIICRIYGVPFTVEDGKVCVCGLSGFQKGVTYPTIRLDKIYHELNKLSEELLIKFGSAHPERSLLMMPLSWALKLPLELILKGEFVE